MVKLAFSPNKLIANLSSKLLKKSVRCQNHFAYFANCREEKNFKISEIFFKQRSK